jgi:glycosyltransferase involved in cell wall biosynthesis
MKAESITSIPVPRKFTDGVTIAIPNWHHELLLPRSISSALQALKTLTAAGVAAEVLVLDDCSRDGSITLLRQLEALLFEAGLRVLTLAENGGLGSTRNTALRLAKYRYIAFLDADNELIADNLPLFFRAIRNTGAALVYGNLLCPATGARPPRVISNESVRERLFVGNYIDACALGDRVQLLDCGGYQTDPFLHGWDDYELNLRLVTQGRKLVFVPVAFAHYYELPQSLITEFNQHLEEGHQRMRRLFNQLGNRAQIPFNSRHLRYHPDIGYL